MKDIQSKDDIVIYKLWITFDIDKMDMPFFQKTEAKLKTISGSMNLIYDRIDNDIYISGTGHQEDFGRMGAMISVLRKKKWFTQYLTGWAFLDTDGEWEDLIDFYGSKNLLA